MSGIVDKDGIVRIVGVTERMIYRGKDESACLILRDVACPPNFAPGEIHSVVESAIQALELRSSPFDLDVRMPDRETVLVIECGGESRAGRSPRATDTSASILETSRWPLSSVRPFPGGPRPGIAASSAARSTWFKERRPGRLAPRRRSWRSSRVSAARSSSLPRPRSPAITRTSQVGSGSPVRSLPRWTASTRC